MDLIRSVVYSIHKQLETYLSNIEIRSDDWVALTSLTAQDGGINEGCTNKVVMSLYSITNEAVISTYTPAKSSATGMYIVAPPLYIDLHLMFMANFAANQYITGLGAISRVISFFQQNPAFTHANCPDLPPQVDKIVLEFTNLNPVDVNYVMGMMGAKYLPSVFYKLRLIPFAADAMTARAYPVRGGDIHEGPQENGV